RIAVRIRGCLDVPSFAAACAEIVRRHEALRTRFDAVSGEPVQRIVARQVLELPCIVLSALPARARSVEAGRLAREEVRRALDLQRGPLLRVRLLAMDAAEHVVLLTM